MSGSSLLADKRMRLLNPAAATVSVSVVGLGSRKDISNTMSDTLSGRLVPVGSMHGFEKVG